MVFIFSLLDVLFYRLMEFFPPNKRTDEHLKIAFDDKGLSELVKLHLAQVCKNIYIFTYNFWIMSP